MLVGRLVGCAATAGVGLSSPLFADHSALKSTQRANTASSSSIVCSRSTAHISVFCEFSLLLLLEQSVDDANTELKPPPLPYSCRRNRTWLNSPARRTTLDERRRSSLSLNSVVVVRSFVCPSVRVVATGHTELRRTVRGGEGTSARRASARNYSLQRCTII